MSTERTPSAGPEDTWETSLPRSAFTNRDSEGTGFTRKKTEPMRAVAPPTPAEEQKNTEQALAELRERLNKLKKTPSPPEDKWD